MLRVRAFHIRVKYDIFETELNIQASALLLSETLPFITSLRAPGHSLTPFNATPTVELLRSLLYDLFLSIEFSIQEAFQYKTLYLTHSFMLNVQSSEVTIPALFIEHSFCLKHTREAAAHKIIL